MRGAREGGSVVCDMDKILYPTILIDSMQLSKRYSSETKVLFQKI